MMRTLFSLFLTLSFSLPLLGLTLGVERPVSDPPTEVRWFSPTRMAIASIDHQFAITWFDQRQVQLFSLLDDQGVSITPGGLYVGGFPSRTLVTSNSTYFVVGSNGTRTSVVQVGRDGAIASDPIEIDGELLAAAGGTDRAMIVVRRDGQRFAFFVSDAGALSDALLVTNTYFDDFVSVAAGRDGFLVVGMSKLGGRMWARFVDWDQTVTVLPTIIALPPAVDSARLFATPNGFLLTYGDLRESGAGCPAPQVLLRTATFDSRGKLLRDIDTGLKYCSTRLRSYSDAASGGGRFFYVFYGYAGHYWELHVAELNATGDRIGPVVPVADRKDDGSLVLAANDAGRVALLYDGYPTGFRSWVAESFPLFPPPESGHEVTRSAPPQYFRSAAAAPDGTWAVAWANDRAFNHSSDFWQPEWRFGRFGADGARLDGTGRLLDLEPIAITAPAAGTFDFYLKTPTNRINGHFSFLRRRLLPDGTVAPDVTIFSDSYRRFYQPFTMSDGTVVFPLLRVQDKLSTIVVSPDGMVSEKDLVSIDGGQYVTALNVAQSGDHLVATWADINSCGIPEGCGNYPNLWSLRFKPDGELIDPSPVKLTAADFAWVNGAVSNGAETAAIVFGVANQPRQTLFRFDAARRSVDGGVDLWDTVSLQSMAATATGFRLVLRESPPGWPINPSAETWLVEFTPHEPLTTETLLARKKLLTTHTNPELIPLRGKDVLFFRRFSTEPKYGNSWQLFFTDVFIRRVPAPPANLRATVTGNDVTLQWDDTSEDERGAIIEFSRDGLYFAEVGRLGANAASAIVRYLASGRWWFRVRAFNEEGHSEPSNVVSVEIAGRRRAVRRD